MALTIDFTFQTTQDHAQKGKIVVDMANTAGISVDWGFYIGITSPIGEVIKAFPGSADATLGAGEDAQFVVSIPLDSNGDYLSGTYTFEIRRRNTSLETNTDETVEYVFVPKNAPDNLSGSASMSTNLSCITGKLVAQDTTNYDSEGLTLIERLITITPPTVDSQDEVTSTASSAELTVAWRNVGYQCKLELEFEWGEEELTAGLTTAISLGGVILYEDVDVDCEDGGICASLECVGTRLTAIYNEACAAGGYSRLPQVTKDKIEWSMHNLAMAKFKYDCGLISESLGFIEIAKEGINCGCGCSGTDTDGTPQPFTAPGASFEQIIALEFWEESETGSVSVFTAKSNGSNKSAAILPKGTGAFQLRTGGNSRGTNAIDLQIAAVADDDAATGTDAIALGKSNRASAQDSFSIGTDNTVNTGRYAGAIGQGNAVTGVHGKAIGQSNNVSGESAHAYGTGNTVSADNAYALGSAQTISGRGAVGLGALLHASLDNQMAHGIENDSFQHTILSPFRLEVSNNSAFLLTLDGTSANDIAFPTQKSGNWMYGCRLLVGGVITATDGGFAVGESFLYHRQFIITKYSGTTAMVGGVEDIGSDIASASLALLQLDITADNTNDLVQLQITPPSAMGAGDTLRCFARLEIIEIAIS